MIKLPKHWRKWFLKGLVFAILSFVLSIAYYLAWGILAVGLDFLGAIGTIITLLLIIPMIAGGLILTGYLIEKINSWIK